MKKKIGIIGGSGLDNPDFITNYQEVEIETPYGKTSSIIKTGCIGNVELAIIGRHGFNHEITPTHVNNRANIFALHKLGVNGIIATTAVGSLREEIKRGDLLVIDQFIDFTRFRKVSFHDNFDKGMFHCPMAEPFDSKLREIIINSCVELNLDFHKSGTVVTIEGPRFSTKAESKMFKAWGADIINMSTSPECALANEIGIPYSAIAMSTDYDCWKEDEAPVTFQQVMEVMNENVFKIKKLIICVLEKL